MEEKGGRAFLVIFHHFALLGIFYRLLQPLCWWCGEMWSPRVALPATAATNSRGGRANVRRNSSDIQFLYSYIFDIFEEILLEISQQFFFYPGSVGCASAGWKTTALALPHTYAMWIAQTRAHQPAPVCGHLQDAGEGISESVTLNWDSSSQLPSNTKWLWMTWKSKFQNFQREHCSVSPMWCSYENGRDCTETHRARDVPRAEGTACKAIIHYILNDAPSHLLIFAFPPFDAIYSGRKLRTRQVEMHPLGNISYLALCSN